MGQSTIMTSQTTCARLTPSDSPRNTRVTPREPNREITFITKMNNVEYVCQQCDKNFDTKQKYLYHLDQNHLGQRWKCHLCGRYFVRRLKRSLHRAVVHPMNQHRLLYIIVIETKSAHIYIVILNRAPNISTLEMKEPRSGNNRLLLSVKKTVANGKTRIGPNRPKPINQSESINQKITLIIF